MAEKNYERLEEVARKILRWAEEEATRAEYGAKSTPYVSMQKAYKADAKTRRAMAQDIREALGDE